jgi:hypothetical protein
MNVYILTLYILNAKIEHKYKFVYSSNCHKVGKEISGNSKQIKYECRSKNIKLK